MRYRFIWGLDLAESEDFTALSLLKVVPKPKNEYQVISLERFNSRLPGILEKFGAPTDEYWSRVIEFLVARIGHPTVRLECCLAVDATGIGRRVLDMLLRSPALRQTGVMLWPFQIRSRETKRFQRQDGLIQVSRADLLSGARLLMGQGRLRIAASLPEAATLRQELLFVRPDERRQEGDGPARTRAHDDLVLSVALAADLGETLTNRAVGGILPIRWVA